MISRILPKNNLNDYKGMNIAKWVFLVLTIVTIGRSLVHILFPDGGAQLIATIPLDTYSNAGSSAIISMFALWGVSQVLLGIIFLIVFLRYKALIPLMYLIIAGEYTFRIIVGIFKPIETVGSAPGVLGTFILVPLALIMFILSIWKKKRS